MRILIFFLISQALTEKSIWDGNEKGKNFMRGVAYIRNISDYIWQGNVNKSSKSLPKDITFLKHVTLRNIKILEADITKYEPGRVGVRFQEIKGETQYNLIFGGAYLNDTYFHKMDHTTCQMSYCENGLYFDSDIVEYKNMLDVYESKLKNVFYAKFVTSDMNFRLDRFTITGSNFPLILCPYKGWVAKYSGTEFIHYTTTGITFSNLYERQILLPGYPRSDDVDIFVCGYIKYEDGSQLTISHEIEIKDYYNTDSIKPINDFRHIWKCSGGDTTDYHYFIYSYNAKGNHNMRHIKKDSLNGDQFYYNDTIYLYSEADTKKISQLKEGIKDDYTMEQIEPLCGWKLPQLKFKLRLESSDGSKVLDGKNGIQTLDVREDMLNKDIYYKCKIVIEEATQHPFLSNYYDQVMETLLVSEDDDGNQIFHNKINFDKSFDGFKKYECAIIYKNKDFEYGHSVEKLSFLTIPLNISITNQDETWRVRDDIVIQCQKRISNMGEIDSIKVEISENFFIEYSNVTSDGIFEVEGDFVRSNFGNLIKSKNKKDSDVKHLKTICNYKLAGGKMFSIVKSGTVLQKTVVTKQKGNRSKKGNKHQKIIIIGLIVGISILVFAIILAITTLFVVKYINKKRRRGKDSSLSSSSSFSSLSKSSMSGSLLSASALSSVSHQNSKSKISKANK
uniref:Ig-like domain-containing protein n=1 Tax=Strongyloides papillosus TaxID=174720 RepID=A0A0N5BDD0_STREA